MCTFSSSAWSVRPHSVVAVSCFSLVPQELTFPETVTFPICCPHRKASFSREGGLWFSALPLMMCVWHCASHSRSLSLGSLPSPWGSWPLAHTGLSWGLSEAWQVPSFPSVLSVKTCFFYSYFLQQVFSQFVLPLPEADLHFLWLISVFLSLSLPILFNRSL